MIFRQAEVNGAGDVQVEDGVDNPNDIETVQWDKKVSLAIELTRFCSKVWCNSILIYDMNKGNNIYVFVFSSSAMDSTNTRKFWCNLKRTSSSQK